MLASLLCRLRMPRASRGQLEPLLQAAVERAEPDWAEVQAGTRTASLSRKTMVPPTRSTVAQ